VTAVDERDEHAGVGVGDGADGVAADEDHALDDVGPGDDCDVCHALSKPCVRPDCQLSAQTGSRFSCGPTNGDRAYWAAVALTAFKGHGIPFETVVERAACHHTAEVLEAEEGEA
jgi:hypothetical protein